jgi:hypothetical protein
MTLSSLLSATALATALICGPSQIIAEDHDHDHGEAHALGDLTLAGTTLSVTMHGEAEAGKDAAVTVKITGGPQPTVVRVWIGSENGRGTVKAKLDGKDGSYHGHCMTPNPMPEDAALWVNIEDADGGGAKGSVALPVDDHDHDKVIVAPSPEKPASTKEHHHDHDDADHKH